MPEPASSLPDQDTVKLLEVVRLGSGLTKLVGGAASMVLKIGGVSSGSLVSKTIVAWASMRVPVAGAGLGRMR